MARSRWEHCCCSWSSQSHSDNCSLAHEHDWEGGGEWRGEGGWERAPSERVQMRRVSERCHLSTRIMMQCIALSLCMSFSPCVGCCSALHLSSQRDQPPSADWLAGLAMAARIVIVFARPFVAEWIIAQHWRRGEVAQR